MAIGAILTLFCLFVFLTVMCTKTWRWFHVTMIFFVFVASNFLVTIAAVSLRTHSSWQRDHDKKSNQLRQLKSDYEAMSQGNRSEQVVKDPIDQRADEHNDFGNHAPIPWVVRPGRQSGSFGSFCRLIVTCGNSAFA